VREITTLSSSKNHSYIAGLDGLRALAISFITAYHFSFSWASGGFLSVDVFFVLAGYLMTAKILQIQENEIDIDIDTFKLWKGRLRRLLPAVYTVIAVIIAWVILLKQELIRTLLGDVVSSFFYMTNWWFIFHKLSYFDSLGVPSPLKHLWFLAVQEQFYFVWSIVLIAGLRYFKKRRMLLAIAALGIILSSVLMGIEYNPDLEPSRIYYGTDTRCFELLIGSFLAMAVPMQKLMSKQITATKKYALNIISAASLVVIILSTVFVDEFQAFLYRGGMLLLDLNTVLLIICLSNPNCFTGRILSVKPLRWIGTRSFEIYLWHYPIIVLTTPVYEIGNPAYWRVGLQLVFTCIIAELMYRFVETPIRKLGIHEYFKKYLSFNIFKWRELNTIKRISAVTAVSLVLLFAIDIIAATSNEGKVEMAEAYPTEVIVAGIEQTASYKEAEAISRGWVNFNNRFERIYYEEYGANLDEYYDEGYTENCITSSLSINETYKEILAIGDSIMLDIAKDLKEKYKNITINGKVARQMSDAIKLAPTYAEFNDADKAVIIELGTNGCITDKQIDSLLDSFSNAHIYLVNTRVPRSWERKVNKILKENAEERERVILVDWYSEAIDHPEYFGRDGVHLKASGSEALTNLICEAMNSVK
jgi:peptidoglycan/LPS O-acetylase OafA/YrhL